MPGLRARIGPDLQPKFLSCGLYDRVESRALRAGNLNFFGHTQRLHVVVVQIESDLSSRNRRMLAEIFGPEQTLLLGGDRSKNN